ncbi:DUF2972 domain-containing protein [Campylobacter volucris]|uniref:DUF2972 domain-containing protein n=1 Tax=Campylobacter volucris TaxID=1031542 RepID=UPI0039832946
MNLPIDSKYIWLMNASTGLVALNTIFLRQCGVNKNISVWSTVENIYNELYNDKKNVVICPVHPEKNSFDKILHLFIYDVFVFFVYRDPIGVLKHALNHINNELTWKNIDRSNKFFNMTYNYNNLFPAVYYGYCFNNTIPSVEFIGNCIGAKPYFTTQKRLNILKKYSKIKNIKCIEFSQISIENAFNTFTKLAREYGFTCPNNLIAFQGRANRNQGDLIYLPVTLYVHSYDLDNINEMDKTSFNLKGGVDIIITTHQIHLKKEGFVDITQEIFDDRKLMFDNIVLLVKSNEYKILKDNQDLFIASKKYLNNYMDALEKHEQKIKDNLITEEQILDYLKNNKDLRVRLKNILDEDLTYVKQNHPEYLQQWEYYQEFEKMCEND